MNCVAFVINDEVGFDASVRDHNGETTMALEKFQILVRSIELVEELALHEGISLWVEIDSLIL